MRQRWVRLRVQHGTLRMGHQDQQQRLYRDAYCKSHSASNMRVLVSDACASCNHRDNTRRLVSVNVAQMEMLYERVIIQRQQTTLYSSVNVVHLFALSTHRTAFADSLTYFFEYLCLSVSILPREPGKRWSSLSFSVLSVRVCVCTLRLKTTDYVLM